MTEKSRFTVINESFTCVHCGQSVQPLQNGSCRNHCPHCFYSLHLDNLPGDRSANCGGQLIPIEIAQHSKKGYQIVHRCDRCGHITRNKMAFDDPVQPDSYEHMLEWMREHANRYKN